MAGRLNPMWIVGGVIVLFIFLNWNKSSCAGKKKAVKAGEKDGESSVDGMDLETFMGNYKKEWHCFFWTCTSSLFISLL